MSPYIKRLREAVGPALIMVPSVSVVPYDADGRILLAFHPDVDAWSTLGGAIEPDETPEEAARREALEEANISVRLDEIITVLGGPEHRTEYANGDEVAYVAVTYRATIVDGVPEADGVEVTALRWFSRNDLDGIALSPLALGLLRFLGWI